MTYQTKLIFDSTISYTYSSSADLKKMMAKLKSNSLRISRFFQIVLKGGGIPPVVGIVNFAERIFLYSGRNPNLFFNNYANNEH